MKKTLCLIPLLLLMIAVVAFAVLNTAKTKPMEDIRDAEEYKADLDSLKTAFRENQEALSDVVGIILDSGDIASIVKASDGGSRVYSGGESHNASQAAYPNLYSCLAKLSGRWFEECSFTRNGQDPSVVELSLQSKRYVEEQAVFTQFSIYYGKEMPATSPEPYLVEEISENWRIVVQNYSMDGI